CKLRTSRSTAIRAIGSATACCQALGTYQDHRGVEKTDEGCQRTVARLEGACCHRVIGSGCNAIGAIHRWVNTPHGMHSNCVVRMVIPRVRTLNPAGSLSTLTAPFDGIKGCSS